MAEENNLDENLAPENEVGLPAENLEDDLEGDSPGTELDIIDEGESEPVSESSLSSNVLSKLKNIPKIIMGSRRNQIIFGVSLIVLLVGVFFVFRGSEKQKTNNQSALGQQESPTFDSSSIIKKKPTKKKKKKIKYIDLYKQLETKQITPILRELSYLNISYNVVQNGKQFDLQVDQNQVDEAKHVLAIKGMPSGAAKGYEIFDEASNLGVTEFDKRIRLIRALSGEMERSIMEFDVVDFAYVEIVIPETKLFAVTQPPVTSSILIKRKNGANINDETVYAILQLVSNSVENLLPGNISVVDTEGRVLSTGVLKRMTEKIKEIEKKSKSITDIGNGKVIIPAIEDVVDWFQLKFNYETVLEKKALNQLNGVLPMGSYKTAVTIDLNSVTRTGAPDIKQIVTSVVVDDQFEEVELNQDTMDQIKQAVAGAVGYVEGRDKLHISKASFLPKRDVISDKELDVGNKPIVLPKDTVFDKLSRLARLWPIFGIGCLVTATFLIIGLLIKSIVQKMGAILSAIPALFKRKKKEEEIEEESPEEPLVEEVVLNEQDVVNGLKTKSDFAKVIQLKAISTQEVEDVVDELKELIKG